MTGARNQKNQS